MASSPSARAPASWRKIGYTLMQTLLLPALLAGFFSVAPIWTQSRLIRSIQQTIELSPNHTPEEKAAAKARVASLDLAQVCFYPGYNQAKFYQSLQKDGIVLQMNLLWWSWLASTTLLVILFLSLGFIALLAWHARESVPALLSSYRWGFGLTMPVLILQSIVTIPLLAYAVFEISVLATDHFIPKLIFIVAAIGVGVLWAVLSNLLRRVPLFVSEPGAQALTPDEAPQLWQEVRMAAEQLKTNPPDHIIAGLSLNFYVTEVPVKKAQSEVTGRTLYLSYPILRQLGTEEILAIIGHELGHFKGADTQFTRHLSPLRLKTGQIWSNLAKGGYLTWPSWGLLHFFFLEFEQVVQRSSRAREFLADRVGSSLTSEVISARALIKVQVISSLIDQIQVKLPPETNLLQASWHRLIKEHVPATLPFWQEVTIARQPHPLDSHPPLNERLAALGQLDLLPQAYALSTEERTSAYQTWFSDQASTFSTLHTQFDQAVSFQERRKTIQQANLDVLEDRKLLEEAFPPITWVGSHWVIHVLCWVCPAALLVIYLILVFATIPLGVKLALAALATLFFGLLSWGALRARDQRITLTIEGLSCSSWRRSLPFKDVANITFKRTQAGVMATFVFKEKMARLERFGFLAQTKAIAESISYYNRKPLIIAEKIHRYFTREEEPPALSVP